MTKTESLHQTLTTTPDFGYKKLNADGILAVNAIQGGFEALTIELLQVCPPGRHASIVVTKLEEACFFAKKAVAHDKRFQAE